MKSDGFGQVEDYTSAFLWMFYLVLVVGLVIVWGVWGYVLALAICLGLHVGIARLAVIRARRDAEWEARVAAAVARGRGRP
ncbi:MAG: hypothetical protein AAF390_03870 [Pseudomonadota bacterium]